MIIPKEEAPPASRRVGDHGASALAFDHEGKLLASGDEMAVIWVWSVGNGGMIATLKVPVGRGNGIKSLAISADGTLLAAGGASGRIDIWDTKTRKIARTLPPWRYGLDGRAESTARAAHALGSHTISISY
jgi:WD40 repeat protein